MDPENQRVEDEPLLRYPPEWNQFREKSLIVKTVQQLSQVSLKQIDTEFQVKPLLSQLLCSAQISDNKFNKKYRAFNRHRQILAYQHSRVNLTQFPDFYLNANEIKSLVNDEIFAIFSQAPLKPFDNFWQAIYCRNIPLIVMLCPLIDSKKGRQADRYWPSLGKCVALSQGSIILKTQSVNNHEEEFVETKILVKGPEGEKTIRHLQWTGWSDFKKPLPNKLESFKAIIAACLEEIQKNHMIWIHCSAGIGRTGTLGAILEGIRLYEKQKLLSIFKIVQNMRRNRFHVVQTIEQYHFLYSFLTKNLS